MLHKWDAKTTLIMRKNICKLSNFHGEGNGIPLQYSCLENPMDGGAWEAAVHGVAKSQIRLGNFTFSFHFHALEKDMATHSSVLAWRIPGMVEPDGLPSMGSHRVGHDWSDLAVAVSNFQGINFQNKQTAHVTQKKKKIKKMGRRIK